MEPNVVKDHAVWTSNQPGRPIPEAMASVQAAAEKVNALIDAWRIRGEITLKIDVLQWPAVFTIHIPLPTAVMKTANHEKGE